MRFIITVITDTNGLRKIELRNSKERAAGDKVHLSGTLRVDPLGQLVYEPDSPERPKVKSRNNKTFAWGHMPIAPKSLNIHYGPSVK